MNKEHLKNLFLAGRDLQAWREAHKLTDDDVKAVLLAVWPHLAPGAQQRQAASVSTPKKAAAAAENGKKGGRPKKV